MPKTYKSKRFKASTPVRVGVGNHGLAQDVLVGSTLDTRSSYTGV